MPRPLTRRVERVALGQIGGAGTDTQGGGQGEHAEGARACCGGGAPTGRNGRGNSAGNQGERRQVRELDRVRRARRRHEDEQGQ